MNNDAPDIYLMKREKSRAGCLRTLLIAAVVVAAGLAVWAVQRWRSAPAEPPVEFPAGAPDAPLPDAPLPVPPEDFAPPADNTPESPSGGAGGPPAEPPATPESPQPEQPVVSSPVPPPPPPPPPSGDASAFLADAKAKQSAGEYDAAREAALQALDAAPGDPAVEAFLSEIAMPLLASRRPMAGKVEYTVASGDSLGKIAGKFNTPVALIARANEIRNDRINVGQTLLLLDGKSHVFTVRVSKSANSLALYLDGRFFKRYRVATGRDGKTPTGTYKIVEKTEHPTWFPSGRAPIPYGSEENELGTHWLALDRPGYGIHGTWHPETIGTQSSDGCVRMLNEEVEELFSILPRGTVVEIVE